MDSTHPARFDPIDAFFSGLGSSFSRGIVAALAVPLGYFVNAGRDWDFFVFQAVLMIFTWGLYGIFFLVGLALLLGGLYQIHRLMVDEGGKLHWFLIFLMFTAHFLPVTLLRRFSDEDYSGFWWLIGSVAGFSAIYWLLPFLNALLLGRLRKPEENADETGETK